MLNSIKTKMETELAKAGVQAEITFARKDMFSVFCEDAGHFVKAKGIFDAAGRQFDSEDCDPEIGFFAYYKF